MATTQNLYTGDGSTVLFSFTFPYLEESDIFVTIDGTTTTEYSLANATTIQFNTPPASGTELRIFRVTDTEELISTFYPGSTIRAQDLNDDFTQTLYVAQEVQGNTFRPDGSLPMTGNLDLGGFDVVNGGAEFNKTVDLANNRITNVAAPVDSTDAANRAYVDNRTGGNTEIVSTSYVYYTATQGDTVLTSNVGGVPVFAVSEGLEQIYVNGALQQTNVDYTTQSSSQITFTQPLLQDDVVAIHCINNIPLQTSVPPDPTPTPGEIDYTYPGGVEQTVQARLEQYVSVKDFGAVGDGVTDDTAAIQAALDTQRNIYLPSGVYLLSSSIKTTISGQHITGENRDNTYLRGVPSTDYDQLRVLHSLVDVSGLNFRPGTDGDPTASPASWACLRITSSWATVHDCRFLSGSDGKGIGIFLDDVNPETGATVAGAYIHTIQNNLIGYTGYAFKQAVYSLCLTNGQQATRFLNNTIWGNVGIQILKGGGNVYGNNLLQSATGTYDVGVGNGFDFSENVSGETCYGNYIERYDNAVILRATASSPSVWRGDYFGNHFDNNTENIFSLGTISFSFWDYVNKTQLINGIKYIYDIDGYDATRSDGVVALRVDTTKGSVEPRRLIFSDTTTLGYTTNNQTLFANTVYNKISGAGASRTGCSLGTGVAEGQLIILYGNSWPVQILNTNAIFSNSESSVTFGNSAGQIVAMQLIWNGGSWVELSRNSV